MAQRTNNTVNTVFFRHSVFSKLFENPCLNGHQKYSFLTPKSTLGRSKVDRWDVLGRFLVMLNNLCFFISIWCAKKSKKSSLGAPKSRQGDFGPSTRRPFSDFGVPGRPQYQRSKYISIYRYDPYIEIYVHRYIGNLYLRTLMRDLTRPGPLAWRIILSSVKRRG